MTTLESWSAVESSMEETSRVLTEPRNLNAANRNHAGRRLNSGETNGGDDDDDDEEKDEDDEVEDEKCDKEAWAMLSKSFRQVQSVLDQNRALIQQVNENHQSKIPDNLLQNVALIREINGNISKVMSIYSDLSVNISNIVHQRRVIKASKNNDSNRGKSNINSDSNEENAGS